MIEWTITPARSYLSHRSNGKPGVKEVTEVTEVTRMTVDADDTRERIAAVAAQHGLALGTGTITTYAGSHATVYLLREAALKVAEAGVEAREAVRRDAAALVDPPRQVVTEVKPFTPAEAWAVLAAVEGDRLAAVFRLALTLGLRQGEVLGLRWEDVDLDGGTLRVRHALQRIDGVLTLKEPKTEKSRRTLRLPPSVVAALRMHGDRQRFERDRAGARWADTGLIFTTAQGRPIDPRNLIRSWHRLLATAGVARRPFHTTRHTAASLLMAEGLPLKVVQEILGHSLLSTTADIYAHLVPAAFQEAADAMERALAGVG